MTLSKPGVALARAHSSEGSSTGQGGAPAELSAEPLAADICIIGAGSGGLTVAAMAAAFGRKVVLIEKHRMGGAALNVGTIPSKALLAAAKRAQAMRTAGRFGITSVDPQVDWRAVQQHVRGVISSLAANDSVERYSGLGIRVILGAARFLDKRTVLAGDYRITARRFVLATGSAPSVPPIPGLDACPYFTTDTIFDVDRKIPHLAVIGGGPVGLELAQAHLRLGSRVTVIEKDLALGNEDPEATAILLRGLRAEGMDIRENASVERAEAMAGFVRLHVAGGHGGETVDASHVLLATGRVPNLSDLNLDAAGIKHTREGVSVNDGLRTSNRRVYAIGDVIGGPQYGHTSSYQAGIVVRRALFWLPSKVDPNIIPRVTFTDPELAHVGLSEVEARATKHKINVLRWPFSENDRAQIEHEAIGHIKVVTTAKKGRILGVTIVGPGAGELIQVWALAIAQRLPIKAMFSYVAPYPTYGEVGKRAAVRQFTTLPSQANVRKLIDFLARLG